MMADEVQEDTLAATGNVATQPDSDAKDDVSQVSQPEPQAADDAAVWKDKYVRLFADLENTKKSNSYSGRAGRNSFYRADGCRISARGSGNHGGITEP
jgi:hypothetical protein